MSEPTASRRGTCWLAAGLLATFVLISLRVGLPIYRRKQALDAINLAGVSVGESAGKGLLAKVPWLAARLSVDWRIACGDINVVSVRFYLVNAGQESPRQTREKLESALRAFREFGEVREINLSDVAGFSDDDLAQLSNLPRLEALVLDATGVSNAGITHLATLPKLRRLSVSNTAVTDLGLDELRRSHPDLEVTDD